MRSFQPEISEDAGSVFEKKSTFPSRDNEHALVYRGKNFKVGTTFRIRFISMAASTIAEFPARKATTYHSETGEKIPKTVIDPGFPHNKEIVDHDGKSLAELPTEMVYRMLVWVYSRRDPDGTVTPIRKLMYVEFTKGLYNSFWKMPQYHESGATAFNERTKRPEYDVNLRIIEGPSANSKMFAFLPITQDAELNKDPNFGRLAEEVLAEYAEEIVAAKDEVVNALKTHGTDLAYIKDALKKWEKKDNSRNDNGISRNPTLSESNAATQPADPPAQEQKAKANVGKADGEKKRDFGF